MHFPGKSQNVRDHTGDFFEGAQNEKVSKYTAHMEDRADRRR